jgi:hypothetical protein
MHLDSPPFQCPNPRLLPLLCTLQATTRAAMLEARLPTPRNARINAPTDVVPAAEVVGFPAVIKPVSGEWKGGQAWGTTTWPGKSKLVQCRVWLVCCSLPCTNTRS